MKKIFLFLLIAFWGSCCFAQQLQGYTQPAKARTTELSGFLTDYESLQFDQKNISVVFQQKELKELQLTIDNKSQMLRVEKWALFTPRVKAQFKEQINEEDFELYKVWHPESKTPGFLLISPSNFYLEYKTKNDTKVITAVDHFLNKRKTTEDYLIYDKKDLVKFGTGPLCSGGGKAVSKKTKNVTNNGPNTNGSSFCEDFPVDFDTKTISDLRIVEIALEIDPAYVSATGGGFGLLSALVIEFSAAQGFYSAAPYNITFSITNSTTYTIANNPYPTVPATNNAEYDAINAAIVSTLASDNSFTRDIVILFTGIMHNVCGSVRDGGIGTFCDGSEVNGWVRFNGDGACPNGLVITHEIGHLFNGEHPANDDIMPPNTACNNTEICNGAIDDPELPNLMCPGCPNQIISLDDDKDNREAIVAHINASAVCLDQYTATITGDDILCQPFQEYEYEFSLSTNTIFVPDIVWTVGPELTIVGSNTGPKVVVRSTGGLRSISTVTATASIQGGTLNATRRVVVNPIPQIKVTGGYVSDICSDNLTFYLPSFCPPDNLTIMGFLPGVPNADVNLQCFGQVTCTSNGNNSISVFVPNGVTAFGLKVSANSDICGQNSRTFILGTMPSNCVGFGWEARSTTEALLNDMTKAGIKDQISEADWKKLEEELTSKESAIKVYPNPIAKQGKLIVEVPLNLDRYELRLLDVNGRTLRTLRASDARVELDVKNLEPGAYFIQVLSDKIVESKKVLITE